MSIRKDTTEVVTEKSVIMTEAMAGPNTITADMDATIMEEAMATTIAATAITILQGIGNITVMPEDTTRLTAGSGTFATMAGGTTTSGLDGMQHVAEG